MTGFADTEDVWRELSGQLREFVARRVSDPEAADDIVQNVFLRIHAGLGGVRDADRQLGWVFQVARNAVIDHYRSAARRRERPTDELPELPSEPVTDDAAVVRGELAACLDPLLVRLAPHYREALALTELGGMSQAQAAEQVGVSVAAMKSRVQRGRQQLFDLLAECCEFEIDGRGAPIGYSPRPEAP